LSELPFFYHRVKRTYFTPHVFSFSWSFFFLFFLCKNLRLCSRPVNHGGLPSRNPPFPRLPLRLIRNHLGTFVFSLPLFSLWASPPPPCLLRRISSGDFCSYFWRFADLVTQDRREGAFLTITLTFSKLSFLSFGTPAPPPHRCTDFAPPLPFFSVRHERSWLFSFFPPSSFFQFFSSFFSSCEWMLSLLGSCPEGGLDPLPPTRRGQEYRFGLCTLSRPGLSVPLAKAIIVSPCPFDSTRKRHLGLLSSPVFFYLLRIVSCGVLTSVDFNVGHPYPPRSPFP